MQTFDTFLILAFLALALIAAFGIYWDHRPKQLPVKQRRELHDLRQLVSDIDQIAWENRDLDPYTAPVIIQEIRKHKLKELR